MLQGHSIIGATTHPGSGHTFAAVNPATGQPLEPLFHSASLDDLNHAAQLAAQAFPVYGKLSGAKKAEFLIAIASGLEAIADHLVQRAHLESGLPIPRLNGELGRTANQLRLFAAIAEEGSWVQARIDPALPDRKPLPRADIRSMLRPIGPVAVFGASNFPLAFSVAGGDTASALAAGNPVIVKAHPAHPGVSELVARVITRAAQTCNLPAGIFALLFDAETSIAAALVQHPAVKAVGFTGSLRAGRALMDLAAARPDPIPCFTEMSSTNPLIILPEALAAHGPAIAAGLYDSYTLGVGQFCTKPGLVFLPTGTDGDAFTEELQIRTRQGSGAVMLTQGICGSFHTGLAQRKSHPHIELLAEAPIAGEQGFRAVPALLQTTAEALLAHPELAYELFGPTTLLVRYTSRAQLLALAQALEGQLTASLHGTEADLLASPGLLEILEQKAGRILFNGFPTGVEVCHAMVHGGPYPATADSRFTSVGSQAIFRFARPVCFQNFPQTTLPEELKDSNPLHIWRLVDGSFTRHPIAS
jgi:NADP-dependent aldehyde dehydrogenase